jgi:hypothetical protein
MSMEVLRFELMINVVCAKQPQASGKEGQHETTSGDASVIAGWP